MPDFPKHYQKRGRKVTVYAPAKGTSSFKVSWRELGKTVQRRARDFKEAEELAKQTLDRLIRGLPTTSALSPSEQEEYQTAHLIAKDLGLTLGQAIHEWKAARLALADGQSLIEAARIHAERNAVKDISVAGAVEEFLGHKRSILSDHYFRQVNGILNKFSSSLQCSMSDIEKADIHQWIKSLDSLKAKTRNHYRRTLSEFFSWSGRMDYLPQDTRLKEALESERAPTGVFSLITPEQFKALLFNATPDIRARLYLQGMCGLRTAESLRVSRDNFRNGKLVLDASQTKTRSRRVVDVPESFIKILESDSTILQGPWAGTEQAYHERYRKAKEAVGIENQRNALRHSFISYRLALTKDEKAVAVEAGTSPEMIFTNYLEMANSEMARRWFSTNLILDGS